MVLCIISLTSYAQSNFYANIGAGFTIPSRNSDFTDNSSFVIYGPTTAPSGVSIFNLPNVNWENNYKNGFNLNMAIGHRFSLSWNSDIEFLYQRFKRTVSGSYRFIEYDAISTQTIETKDGIPITPSTGNVNVYSLLTNGYYNFNNSSKWAPLLGAGFGIAWFKAGSTTATGSFTTPLNTTPTPTLQQSPALSGTAAAWQFKAGFSYAWNHSTSIIMQYRLFATSQFIAKSSSIITNPNLGSSSRKFSVSQHTIKGLVTNAIEVVMQFDL